MKKILIALVLLIVCLLAAVYLFIPGKIQLRATISLNAAFPAVSRTLIDKNNWKRWWPGEPLFNYDNQTFSIRDQALGICVINIHSGNDTINSMLELVPVRNDSMTITWHAEQETSSNPFLRLSRYRQAATSEKNMNKILQSMKVFFEKTINIYGFEIKRTLVADSVLISMRRSFEQSPTVQEIDAMLRDLRKYIAQNGALEKNSPMLNVVKLDSSHYEAMTAVPVDRALPPTKEFAPKFLLKGGNILEGQIQGGPTTIENSLRELENYRSDYLLTSPAIPYQLLITDRVKEADTTKWITKLYYPIF
jgi:hypothetical protein